MWKGSLSYFKYFNFSFMPRTVKNYDEAKDSNLRVTLFHETEDLLKAADQQKVPQIILSMLQQLDGKIELHIHFIINSVVAGNNVTGNDINVVVSDGNTMVATHGDHCDNVLKTIMSVSKNGGES
jgi:hypothetical protein